jgi:pimeloyl-ACP methyl ester carboxylesterase
MDGTKVDTLKVPGASLYYEVSGAGPALLMIPGAPADAGVFGGIAGQLADRYTVVTYDTRGTSRSPLDGPPEDQRIEVHADDAARLIAAIGEGPANVLGCSGGALIGLDLVGRYPERVRTLVAHEPPAMNLLPDAAGWRAAFQDVCDTYRRDGVGPAIGRFIVAAMATSPEAAADPARVPQAPPMPDMSRMSPETLESMARMQANFEFLFAHILRTTIGHKPDIAAVRAAPSRVVVAVGQESEGQMPNRAGLALAERLGIPPVEVPGDHAGFSTHPEAFAEAVHEALSAT